MAVEFRLPKLGENIPSGDIVGVLVQVGDQIAANQPVFDVMADKTNAQVQCPFAGRVLKIHVSEGETVPIDGVLLTLDTAAAGKTEAVRPGEPPVSQTSTSSQSPPSAKSAAPAAPSAIPQQAFERPPAASPKTPTAVAVSEPTPVPETTRGNGGPAPASPATRRFARELGVDLRHVPGSGPGGRISREDVMESVRQAKLAQTAANSPAKAVATPATPTGETEQDAWGPIVREPLSRIRKTIATQMARSASTIPHVTNFDDADITELERIRKGSMADYVGKNVKLTMMAFVIKAVSHALKLHPAINASLDLEQEQVIRKQYVSIGIAVDSDRGLLVPVMRHVDRLSIPQIAQSMAAIVEQARASKLTIDDLRGGTFTISNLGAIGGSYSTPIINHPEVAILLVGRSREMPVIVEGEIKIRLMMPLSLSYDHRWVDGATAARFLNEVIGSLEAPGRLLLAP